jgi:glycolate oxidase iron-sulfur subunit
LSTRAWDDVRPPELKLIQDCVHCGFCLPTCPSYIVFEEEMDSPRGRIVLMRVGHEEGSSVSPEMTTHLDRCLGCMACVTACPSGVKYDRLIERARPQLERHGARTWRERALRRAIFALFTHPARLRSAVPLLALQSAAVRIALRQTGARNCARGQHLPEVPGGWQKRSRIALCRVRAARSLVM